MVLYGKVSVLGGKEEGGKEEVGKEEGGKDRIK
jgi:hypothetical protein